MKKGLLCGILVLVAGLLAGCGGSADAATVAPEDVPVVTQDDAGSVVAEAVIEPARSSTLTFDVPGDVADVMVEEGDAVLAGDPLVRLETDSFERALAQADLSLRQAQLRLDRIQEPADDSDLAVARAAVSDAAAAYEEAQMAMTVVENGVSVGDQVRAARAARDETYRDYQNLVAENADESMIAAAHDAYLNALGAYNRAVEGSELELAAAQNQVDRAYHALVQAQNGLDDLVSGADEADIEAARLDVEAAQLALEAAQDSLDEATLVAPFDGIVATVSVSVGDAAAPGQPVVVMATLDELQARTTDLAERDVVSVQEGQSATVTVDALPDETFEGVVSDVALQPGDYRGDVVYGVTIQLGEGVSSSLRWGMTALVEIETE